MSTWGASAEQLEAVAAALGEAADVIDHNRVRINNGVHQAPWRGSSADRFRRDWDAIYVRHLTSAAGFLHAARTTLMRNAAEQRQASGVSGASGPATRVPSSAVATAGLLSSAFLRGLVLAAPRMTRDVATAHDWVSHGKYVYDVAKDVEKYRVDVGRLHRVMSGAVGKIGPFDIVDAGFDAAALGASIGSGNVADALWSTGHVAVDVVSVAVPEVGLVYGAGSLGWWIGSYLGEKGAPVVAEDASRSLFHGKSTDELTPDEAAQFSRRYEGVGGFANFAHDSAGTAVHAAQGFLRRVL